MADTTRPENRVIVRLVVVAAVLVVVALGRTWYRRSQRRLAAPTTTLPLTLDLTGGADHTWVLFTTPYCATCGPVKERIGSIDPGARIVEVDVAARPDLADRFAIRTAPTVLLAGRDGEVRARLVGNVPAAVLSASLA